MFSPPLSISRVPLVLLTSLALLAPSPGCDPGGEEVWPGGPAAVAPDGSGGSDGVGMADVATTAPDTTGPAAPAGPAVPVYSGGVCPGLVAGYNAIETGGVYRYATITLPPKPQGAAVAFLWHGFGDSGANFTGSMNAGAMSASQNLIVVAPDPLYDPGFGMPKTWHVMGNPGPDLGLFDDVLACLEVQYDIDERRVYTIGFSAGALWSSLLLIERSQHLAAATIWSGGTSAGGLVSVPYVTPVHKTPAFVAWGGATDIWGNPPVGVNFQTGCLDLVDKLVGDGHLVVGCDHGEGHTIPFNGLQPGWDFLLSHTWGEESPYADGSLTSFPSYCGLEGP